VTAKGKTPQGKLIDKGLQEISVAADLTRTSALGFAMPGRVDGDRGMFLGEEIKLIRPDPMIARGSMNKQKELALFWGWFPPVVYSQAFDDGKAHFSPIRRIATKELRKAPNLGKLKRVRGPSL